MVNIFARAGILTLIILTAWFLLSTALEGDRNTQLLGQIDTVIAQESAINTYLDYLEATEEYTRYCSVFEEHIRQQNQKLFPLLELLDQARQNSLQNQYQILRQRFQAANAQLYFSLKQFEKKCRESEELKQPILYFFPDNGPCSDCVIQVQILEEVKKTCTRSLQIFAFPVEGGVEIVDLLVKDYRIQRTPSLVINDEVYQGVQKASILKKVLECQS